VKQSGLRLPPSSFGMLTLPASVEGSGFRIWVEAEGTGWVAHRHVRASLRKASDDETDVGHFAACAPTG